MDNSVLLNLYFLLPWTGDKLLYNLSSLSSTASTAISCCLFQGLHFFLILSCSVNAWPWPKRVSFRRFIATGKWEIYENDFQKRRRRNRRRPFQRRHCDSLLLVRGKVDKGQAKESHRSDGEVLNKCITLNLSHHRRVVRIPVGELIFPEMKVPNEREFRKCSWRGLFRYETDYHPFRSQPPTATCSIFS